MSGARAIRGLRYTLSALIDGLILTSALLLISAALGFEQTSWFFLDKHVFGFDVDLVTLIWSYILDLLILLQLRYSLMRSCHAAPVVISIGWLSINVFETLADIVFYSKNPNLVFEELFFLAIYIFSIYLLVLFLKQS